jgi:hypothetical protein
MDWNVIFGFLVLLIIILLLFVPSLLNYDNWEPEWIKDSYSARWWRRHFDRVGAPSGAPVGIPSPKDDPSGTPALGKTVPPILILYKGAGYTGDSLPVYDIGAEILFANQTAGAPGGCKTPNRQIIYKSFQANPGTILELNGTTSGSTDRGHTTVMHNVPDIDAWILQNPQLSSAIYWHNDQDSWCYWDRPFKIKVLSVGV